MNKKPPIREATLTQKEQFLLEHALEALRNATGLVGKPVATEHGLGGDIRPDATVEIDVGGKPHRYTVAIKRIDRFAAIGQIKNQLERFPQPGLLVAPRITTETVDICRELDVQFIDAHGNAYLHAPGMFVLVKGQRLPGKGDTDFVAAETPRAGTPTALKVIFALICLPELLNAPYREINQVAGVALGAVGWVFFDLNNRGYTTGGNKKGDRRMLERQRLIDEWVTNFPIKLRPKLNPRRFHAPDPEWWHKANIAQYGARWGGEVAADRLTAHLKANTVTLYMNTEGMRQNLTKLVAEHKLRADPDGEIEVLETFWNFPPDHAQPDLVPPLLVYADLLATMDPRNIEVARWILDQHLNAPDTQA